MSPVHLHHSLSSLLGTFGTATSSTFRDVRLLQEGSTKASQELKWPIFFSVTRLLYNKEKVDPRNCPSLSLAARVLYLHYFKSYSFSVFHFSPSFPLPTLTLIFLSYPLTCLTHLPFLHLPLFAPSLKWPCITGCRSAVWPRRDSETHGVGKAASRCIMEYIPNTCV